MSGIDIVEIINVLNTYALAIDTMQWDLMDRVFTPDVRLEYPGEGGVWTDLALYKKFFSEAHEPFDTCQHYITNHQVVVNGDTANAICYVFVRHTRNMKGGGGNYWEMGGWYDDQLIRTPNGWRIKKRACRGNWWDGNMQVTETSGVPTRYDMDIMRREARAGKISYLDALRKS